MEQLIDYLTTAGYIVLCVLLFSLAIFIHEFGHFIVALKLGLRVTRFSIGFGPAIWKRVWKGVEYRISWLPFGGYVMIPDLDPEGTKKLEGGDEMAKDPEVTPSEPIPPWKEILVAVAGPGMNIVLAVVLACILAVIPSVRFGETLTHVCYVPQTLNTLSGKEMPSPAFQGGLKPGDEIVAVNGRAVRTWIDLQTEVQIAGERESSFDVVRHGTNSAPAEAAARLTLKITPVREPTTGYCVIGAMARRTASRAADWMPNRNPVKQLLWDAGSICRILKALVTPRDAKATSRQLGGAVSIAQGIYHSMRRDIWDGIGFLRFLNVNLAMLNLLPIPVLDGGLILFSLLALLFRRRVPEKIVGALTTVFMVLLLGVMVLLIGRDVLRTWRIHEALKDVAAREKSVSTNATDNVQTNANPATSNR